MNLISWPRYLSDDDDDDSHNPRVDSAVSFASASVISADRTTSIGDEALSISGSFNHSDDISLM